MGKLWEDDILKTINNKDILSLFLDLLDELPLIMTYTNLTFLR